MTGHAQVAYDERDTVTIQASETLALRGGTPVRSSFLPFHQPFIDAEDELAVVETLRSGWLTTGPRTKSFENRSRHLYGEPALRSGELVHRGAPSGARSRGYRPG